MRSDGNSFDVLLRIILNEKDPIAVRGILIVDHRSTMVLVYSSTCLMKEVRQEEDMGGKRISEERRREGK